MFFQTKVFGPSSKKAARLVQIRDIRRAVGSESRSDFLSPPDWLMVGFGSRAEEEIPECPERRD